MPLRYHLLMQMIGIIGGMSWESTITYYRVINRTVGRELGGFHSARILLHSVDFHEIEELQRAGQWDEMGRMLADAARSLEAGGADFLVLATNTMHKVADAISAATPLPLLHIADATAEAIRAHGVRNVGLLGTRYTMEQDFYRARLEDPHELTVIVPDEEQRLTVNRIIFEELVHGRVLESSRRDYQTVIRSLANRGAEAIILGCTEIGLLIQQNDAEVPLFDTTLIHAEAAAMRALGSESDSRKIP